MKKIIFTLAFICILTSNSFGQEMLNVNTYYQLFNIRRSADIIDSEYVWIASDNDILSFGSLNWNGRQEDDTGLVDTPLEFALLTYYSQEVRNIRPAQANEILPANNPRLVGLKLGSALYQDIQVLRFLANNNAVERDEAMLRFVCDRNRVTRAEIETFYRNNIRALISQVVDEEFNKVSFLVENRSSTHTSTLIRNPQTKQYILSYGGTYTNEEIRTITANSLDALLSEMGRRTSDFDQTGINAVRAQAALIPAVALSASVINDAVNLITAFYLNPSLSTLNALRGRHRTFSLDDGDRGRAAAGSFIRTINDLNPVIADRVLAV